jgi:hypothetical protein
MQIEHLLIQINSNGVHFADNAPKLTNPEI